jgi:2-polyprenyl-6-methoxyphenol hydroxylase-like FAD-dependent oxidoreductase
MNHGIADAVVLVRELVAATTGSQTVPDAVSAYEKEMISRAGEEVVLGVANTEMLHDWSRFADSAIMTKGGNPNEQAQVLQKSK